MDNNNMANTIACKLGEHKHQMPLNLGFWYYEWWQIKNKKSKLELNKTAKTI